MKQIIFSIFIFLGIFGYAQESFIFERIRPEDGLSHGEVHAILCDSYGFMWFGTKNGIDRWDGYSIKSFRNVPGDNSSLAYNTVRCIFEDSDSVLWVGTSGGGLHRFNRETNTFKRYRCNPNDKTSLAHDNVYAIFEDSHKRLWIGTYGGGLQLLNRQSDTFTTYTKSFKNKNSLIGNSIRAIKEDSEGNLWIACDGEGLTKFNYEQNTFTNYVNNKTDKNSLSSNATLSILIYNDTTIYIGTWAGGVSVLNPKTEQFKTIMRSKENSLSSNEVFSIYKSSEDTIWFTTRRGLDCYIPSQNKFIHNRHEEFDETSISHDMIMYVTGDKTGGIWVATAGTGVCKTNITGAKFLHIKKSLGNENTLLSQNVVCFFEDRDSNIWIGTVKGIQKINIQTLEFETIDLTPLIGVSEVFVKSITQDNDGNIWFSVDSYGIIVYTPVTKRLKLFQKEKKNSLSNNSVNSMVYDKNRNTLLLGTYGGGLDKFDLNTMLFKNFPVSSQVEMNNVIFDIEPLSSNEFIVSTISDGLMKFDSRHNIFQKYYVEDPYHILDVSEIMDVYISEDKTIWIGTTIGLHYISNNKLINCTPPIKNSFICNGILQVDNKLWVSTNDGIYYFDIKTKQFEKRYAQNGIQGLTFNPRATMKDKKGYLFFGGGNGFNRFIPSEINTHSSYGNIVITAFKLGGESISPKSYSFLNKDISLLSEIIIPSHIKTFSLEIAYLHYSDSKANMYAYMIEGFDTCWVSLNNKHRIIQISNLPGGKYRLLIKAANAEGEWTPFNKELIIIIETPFWKTKLFVIIIILFFISVFITLILIRERINKFKQKNLKEQLKQSEVIIKQNEKLERMYYQLQSKNEEIVSQHEYLEEANKEIQKKNELILFSIEYAERLQRAMLPTKNEFENVFTDFFIIYKPRDVVSGDFYWVANEYDSKNECQLYFIIAIDCTGHGVPGAFLTIVAKMLLDKIVKTQKNYNPAEILEILNEEIYQLFSKSLHNDCDNEGMDMTICRICEEKNEVIIASAIQTYAVSNDGMVSLYEGDIYSIGNEFRHTNNKHYNNKHYIISKSDMIFLFSDGITDQFGDNNKGKFLSQRFQQVLQRNIHLSTKEQQEKIIEEYNNWKGSLKQLDDILIIGIKIKKNI